MITKLDVKESYRADTEIEVKNFIEQSKTEANENGYVLQGYSSTHKEKKSKGEIIDEGYQITLHKVYEKFWDVGGDFE